MKAMCLQAMAVVYGHCFDHIGSFNDTEYIVTMLNRVGLVWLSDTLVAPDTRLLDCPACALRYAQCLSHVHTFASSPDNAVH